MSHTSLRTQIILPKELREEIDKERRISGESLAAYLRQAAQERMARQKKRKTDLKKLAQEVVGSVKRGAWTGVDVSKWQRQIRAESEERLEREWRLPRRKKGVSS